MGQENETRMPAWKSHRRVHAAQIYSISSTEYGLLILVQWDAVAEIHRITDKNFTARYQPKIGDYLLIYDDGFVSVCPKRSFENGYARMARTCNTSARDQVYAVINGERDYQDMRKSRDSGAPSHSVEEYLLYMEDYLQEARRVASRTWGPDAKPATLDIVRKVTALGVACMEDNGAIPRKLITNGDLAAGVKAARGSDSPPVAKTSFA